MLARLFPWYGLRFALVGRVAPGLVPQRHRHPPEQATDDLGFFTGPPADGRRHSLTRLAIRDYVGGLVPFELGEKPILALRDLLDSCRAEGVRAALLMMPESARFRAAYPPALWAQIEELLGTLSAEYAVPFVNAREWLGEEGFLDGHHLLPAGAEALTERLARDELGPWIRGTILGGAGPAAEVPRE